MEVLDYRPVPPARKPLMPGRKAAASALVLLLLLGGAAWFAFREPPDPPTYYQTAEFLSLHEEEHWRVHTHPTIPGPYRILSFGQPQSSLGGPLTGWMTFPQGRVAIDVPAMPDTSLLAVGVANPAGQHDLFVFYRVEREWGAASQPAAGP